MKHGKIICNSFLINICLLALLSSCASIVSKGKYSDATFIIPSDLSKKSITLRSYSSWENDFISKLGPTSASLDSALKDIISKSNNITLVSLSESKTFKTYKGTKNSAKFLKNLTGIKEPVRNTAGEIELATFLNQKLLESQNDFFIEIVENRNTESKGSWQGVALDGLWKLTTVLSIGLIPYYDSIQYELNCKIYNKDRKLVDDFKIENEVSRWVWTPLIFRKDSIPANDESYKVRLVHQSAIGALAKIFLALKN